MHARLRVILPLNDCDVIPPICDALADDARQGGNRAVGVVATQRSTVVIIAFSFSASLRETRESGKAAMRQSGNAAPLPRAEGGPFGSRDQNAAVSETSTVLPAIDEPSLVDWKPPNGARR